VLCARVPDRARSSTRTATRLPRWVELTTIGWGWGGGGGGGVVCVHHAAAAVSFARLIVFARRRDTIINISLSDRPVR